MRKIVNEKSLMKAKLSGLLQTGGGRRARRRRGSRQRQACSVVKVQQKLLLNGEGEFLEFLARLTGRNRDRMTQRPGRSPQECVGIRRTESSRVELT
ncbi:hypothetical protein J6590_027889 [Homalodisca vitripennis]|nr:hypothetical protein J6590_027889 [Homalodisca vitripennis]